MKSAVIRNLHIQGENKKRAVEVAGRRTSVSLEPIFWDQLRKIASRHAMTVHQLVTLIDQERDGSLTSAIRVFVLGHVSSSCGIASAVPSQQPHYLQ